MFLVRREFVQNRDAAIKIQAWWRMIRARKAYIELKSAAVRIQSLARALHARAEYRELWIATQKRIQERRELAAAIKLQSVVRMMQQRRKFNLVKRAAVAVQARRRGNTARAQVAQLRELRNQSATKIQAWWRMVQQILERGYPI
jgi:abnormal spindle-like microcephaly-associated protein